MPLKTVVDWRSQKSGRMLCCVCVCASVWLVPWIFRLWFGSPFSSSFASFGMFVVDGLGWLGCCCCGAGLIGSAEFLLLFFFCLFVLFVLFSKCQPNLLLLLISSECDRFSWYSNTAAADSFLQFYLCIFVWSREELERETYLVWPDLRGGEEEISR